MSNKTTTAAIASALREHEQRCRDAIDHYRDLASTEEDYARTRLLRDALELVRCLSRLVDGRTVQEIHHAFGAPGDFGYETPLGDALSRFYRGES